MIKNYRKKYYNLPKICTKSDYYNLIEKYVKIITNFGYIESIYSLGNIIYPGLSDIDLIIVLNSSNIPHNIHKITSIKSIEKFDNKNLFTHEPFICDVTTFKNILLINNFSNLKCIHGKKYTEKHPINKIYADIGTLQESIFSFKIFFDSLKEAKCVNIRYTIPNLNSLKYSIESFLQIAKHYQFELKYAWNYYEYIDKLNLFRENFFTLSNPQKIKELDNLILLGSITAHMLEVDFSCLIEEKIIEPKSESTIRGEILLYWYPIYLKTNFKKYIKNIDNINYKIKDNILYDYLIERANILYNHVNFLKRNNYYYGYLFPAWFIKNDMKKLIKFKMKIKCLWRCFE